MPSYAVIYDLHDNATLRKQVVVACRIAARDILTELPATPKHAERLQWARAVQEGSAPPLFDRMLSLVAMNATIQAAAPNGPFLDSDVQFVVNSNLNVQVG